MKRLLLALIVAATTALAATGSVAVHAAGETAGTPVAAEVTGDSAPLRLITAWPKKIEL